MFRYTFGGQNFVRNWEKCSDYELVLASLIGHLGAFDELAIRYQRALYVVAQQIVGSDDAEDVVQEALLLAFKCLPKLEDLSKFASWMYAITRNCALQHRNQMQRQRSNSDLESITETESTELSPEQSILNTEWYQVLHNAIEKLKPELQIVLKLYYWEDLRQREIANFLGLPLTTIKWQLHQAKRSLRQFLRKEIEK